MMGVFARMLGQARSVGVAATMVFGAALVAPASALADESFTTSGSITYTWLGDASHGCAALGLCAVQGQLTLGSQGGSSGSSGGPRGTIDVPIETLGSIVRVADGPTGGSCVDRPGNAEGGGNLLITRKSGRLVAQIEPPASSGRCPGPRQQDLASLLLPVKRTGSTRASFALRTSLSLAAGPFIGTMVSTLVVSSTPTPGGSVSVTSGSSPSGGSRSRKVLLERVALRYRIAAGRGALDVAFSGASDPFCAAFDACGTSGTLALALPGFERTFVVQADRVVAKRVDGRHALADFRSGRLRLNRGGFAPLVASATAQVAETFAGAGGWRCQAAARTRVQPLFLAPASLPSGRGVSLSLSEPVDSEVLRTYCPGPTDADVFGNAPELARTSVGLPALLARRSTISLTWPGRFDGIAYAGTRSGGLALSLTLEHVRAGTVTETWG